MVSSPQMHLHERSVLFKMANHSRTTRLNANATVHEFVPSY
ncbi:hypothetical protein RSAG8_11340, partial [Rhizoctonia solani AG-8 WAC10335]